MKISLTSALVAAAIGLTGTTFAQAGEGGPDAIGAQGAGSPAAANVSNGATVGGLPPGSAPSGFTPGQIQRERDTPSQGTTGQARRPPSR
jgi:hypothetical protein